MMSTNIPALKTVLEAALLAAGQPLSLEKLESLFGDPAPSREELLEALMELGQDCTTRGVELREVASGFRLQVRSDLAPWISRLWEEKPARYSRALLETLALIAYRQPISRAEIEDVRGVAVSTHIIKTLQDREWIRVVGHREVPGRPALYGTTRQFLDYFNLRGLDDLPPLSAVRDLEEVAESLDALLESQAAQAVAEAKENDEGIDAHDSTNIGSSETADAGADSNAADELTAEVSVSGEAFDATDNDVTLPNSQLADSPERNEQDRDPSGDSTSVSESSATTEAVDDDLNPRLGFKPPRTANG